MSPVFACHLITSGCSNKCRHPPTYLLNLERDVKVTGIVGHL